MKKNAYARSAAVPPTDKTITTLRDAVLAGAGLECDSALLALGEHYGELCRALLQDQPTAQVRTHALLCAAYALKLVGVRAVTQSVRLLLDETVRAGRAKFPGNSLMLAALGEEFGELCGALGKLDSDDAYAIQVEALQVAGIALRIYEEGDAAFCDVPEEVTKP